MCLGRKSKDLKEESCNRTQKRKDYPQRLKQKGFDTELRRARVKLICDFCSKKSFRDNSSKLKTKVNNLKHEVNNLNKAMGLLTIAVRKNLKSNHLNDSMEDEDFYNPLWSDYYYSD